MWTINDTPAGTTRILSEGYERGDDVRCAVLPTSGTRTGTSVSARVTIANSSPTAEAPSLAPEMAREGSTLTCTPGALTDPDSADVPIAHFSWLVNQEPIDGGASLNGAYFDRGDEVVCVVTPADDVSNGTAVSSNVVSIGNTPPMTANARFDPPTPVAGDRVTCLYDYEDEDGDPDRSEVTWT